MKPIEIRREAAGLQIHWSDNEKSFSGFGEIRKSCSCAVCKEMKTPLSENLPFYQKSISMRSMNLVGNYALEIHWEDAHRSIISFDRLKTL